jgi:hypothetical protein
MADLRGFDANQVEPSTDFDPIPAGTYEALIIGSEMKAVKAGTGHYLQLTFEIIDGPHKGRKVWARLNLANSNETTVKIAQAELSAICRAVRVLRPNDSVELHNLPLQIKVRLKKRKDTQELVNEIHGYSPKGTVAETTGGGKPPLPSASGTPPWKR